MSAEFSFFDNTIQEYHDFVEDYVRDKEEQVLEIVQTEIEKLANPLFSIIRDIKVDIRCTLGANGSLIYSENTIGITLKDELYFSDKYEESYREYEIRGVIIPEDDSIIERKSSLELSKMVKETLCGVLSDLYHADAYHAPLWRLERDNITENDYLHYAKNFFGVETKAELSKEQRDFLLNFLASHNNIMESSSELIAELRNFVKQEGRFPFQKEWMYKKLEYANSIGFFSNDDIELIAQIKSESRNIFAQKCYDDFVSFIKSNKRWLYPSDTKMIKTFDYVCRYWRYGMYSEKQSSEIDRLFKRYYGNETKGENAINTYLFSLGYSPEKQYKFDDCRDKNVLPFDVAFFIGEQLCLIEFDGKQHFEPVEFFGGKEHTEYIQRHDKIKDDYCERKHIPLLRIRYDQMKEIRNLVDKFITGVKKELEEDMER